jgi:ferritin-like metal-binding protein YciE
MAKSTKNKNQGSADPALKKLFIDEIRDIYWAEKKLVTTLPKMQKAATSEELASAFESHLEETKGHVERLEEVFDLLGETARGKKCEAMEGLVKEGEGVIDDTEEGTATRDVGLILSAQKVEHYEIATYGGLTQLATTLGLDDVANILAQTLEEEKACDEKLTAIAENDINYQAAEEEV